MIVYDLECRTCAHRFEAWFGSSSSYEEQQTRHLVCCPVCSGTDIGKAPMAPNLGKAMAIAAERSVEASGGVTDDARAAALRRLMSEAASLQAEMLKASTWVGPEFADKARAMHYGETDTQAIHGEVDVREAKALIEEGVTVAPLLFPIVSPKQQN